MSQAYYRITCQVITIISIMILFVGCNNPQEQIMDNISRMRNMRVIVPYEKLLLYKGHYTCCDYSISDSFTLIAYIDSNECSPCYLGRIQQWEPLIDTLRNKYHSIRTTIIFAPPKVTQQYFFEKLKYTKFKYPIYIDTCGIFSEANKSLPTDKMYHTFLLDESRQVILVGNPFINSRIKNLLLEILSRNKTKYS